MPNTRTKTHRGSDQELLRACALPLAALLRKPLTHVVQSPALLELARAMRDEAAQALRGRALAWKTGSRAAYGRGIPSLDDPRVREPLPALLAAARRARTSAPTISMVRRIFTRLLRELRRP